MDMESGGHEITFNGPHSIDLSNVKENFCTICDLQLVNVRAYILHNCHEHGISNRWRPKNATKKGQIIKKKAVFELSQLNSKLLESASPASQHVIENYCTICEVKFPTITHYIRHNADAHYTGLFYVSPIKDTNSNFKPKNATADAF